jgi:hypothetical protein
VANVFWSRVTEEMLQHGELLRQGDFLPHCHVPVIVDSSAGQSRTVTTDEYDLIVMTQSCDLDRAKTKLVALCPAWTTAEFIKGQDEFGQGSQAKWRGYMNDVRKGRIASLHLLSSPLAPDDPWQTLVIDFREIYSVPFAYLLAHAATLSDRWRLRSPYLEHFSQAFARFFMRVGLPTDVPEFK